MITPYTTGQAIARDGWSMKADVVAAADALTADAQPVLLPHEKSAVRRPPMSSPLVSNRVAGSRISGADASVYRVPRVTLG
jgi:hypothetical protein